MDSQDQRKTHTPGHESHGVHVCHKCGWPFPNPHPSAKNRRAHKKICGTIDGYKVCLSEDQSRLNVSDDEHGSEDDKKSPSPKILEVGHNEKDDIGIGGKTHRSEDEVFSDAVADFTDGGLSQGVKEHLQEEILDSGTSVEKLEKDPKFSSSSEHNDINDVSKLTLEAGDNCQAQHPEISQGETVEDGNTTELQDHLSGSTVEQLSNSIADFRAEESTIFHRDDILGLSNESKPSKAEAMTDILPENQSFACENVADCSLASSAAGANLKGTYEIKSESKEIEIIAPSDAVVGETCEVESKIEVSDAVYLDHQVAEGAVNHKEMDSAEFLSVLGDDDPSHGSNSVGITNDSTSNVQIKSSHASDVKILQEKEEANVHANNHPVHEDRTDVPHTQSEKDDFKDHEGVVAQNFSGLLSSDSVKREEEDLKDTVTEGNSILLNPGQLAEKSHVRSLDMHAVMDSSGSVNKEVVNSEPRAEEIYAEADIEVLPVESTERSDEIGASMTAIKSDMIESHPVPSSEELGPGDVENSKQVTLSENILMASSNENSRDASFGAVAREAHSVININNNHHENNIDEINDLSEEGNDVGANLEKDLDTHTNDFQSSDLLQLEVNQSNDLTKSEDAGEMDKTEKLGITNAQCSETASNQISSPVILEPVIDDPTGNSTGIECTNKGLQSGSLEDVKEDEIISNAEVYEECNRYVGTSADSHQEKDAELLMKTADNLSDSYTSLSSLNAEPSAQNDYSAEDKKDGHPGSEFSGTTAMPVQDGSGNSLVKHSSSGIDASAHSSSPHDSLDANWGSVSVLSMQYATAIMDTETSPSTGLVALTTKLDKAIMDTETSPFTGGIKASSEKQLSSKSEMFEASSFMTLVEPGLAVSHKAAASEDQKGKNPQQPSSTTSQAGWFPYVTQADNESQGRNKNEEIIAKVANWSTSKEHTPLKSLLGEAIHSNSPKQEDNLVNQKNAQRVPESNNGSGLTTVNSILGPESPSSVQAVIGDAAKEWNSPARYPADMKREKRKSKSRPYWIQLVCCSTVDLQRR